MFFPGDAVIPKRGKFAAMKIFHRFHFSSALKRMSVIAGYSNPGSSETIYIACVKVLLSSLFSSTVNLERRTAIKMASSV